MGLGQSCACLANLRSLSCPPPLSQLVAGSVVMAFEEVCPERIDLIHKNYRKLCNLLIDVEEWGQVVIINMLTRYARTQFLSPTQNVSEGASRESNLGSAWSERQALGPSVSFAIGCGQGGSQRQSCMCEWGDRGTKSLLCVSLPPPPALPLGPTGVPPGRKC